MTAMKDKEKLIHLLGSLSGDPNEKIEKVANYLGYPIGSNPVNPDSAWKMLLHDQLNDADQSVLAIRVIDELTEVTPIREVRKLHEQVTALNEELGASFIVPLAAFIGNHRIVLYRVGAGNRDERLDLTVSSVQKVSLYAEQFNQRLIKQNLRLEEDEFGFGYDIIGLNDLFKRELSTRFQQTIELYRKKISEAITGSSVRSELSLLVTEEAQEAIKRDRLAELVENPSYKSGLGCVVDTIILRQLLRRFLEGYYGEETFDVSGIALGIGAGTLESALQEVVQVYRPEYEDKALQIALKKERMVPKQITMGDLFMEDELIVTSDVTFKQGGKEKLIDIYERVRMQFEVAYGGDLFAGSVGEATNRVERRLSNEFPDLMAKLWADTSTDQYSFRYEDLPPELLQQQYEASMSRSVQIKLQDGRPVVFYGDDKQERKEKGAYYTDAKLVDYMVKQALKPVFETRLEEIRTAIAEDDEYRLVLALDHLLALKVVDMTCGGGSFLRGAFHWLTDRHQTLSRLGVKEEFLGKYPMLQAGDEGRNAWEKHLLLHVIYGVDIDYKALIICSQTITLSALRYWKMGEGFPELIGKTLIHQNALIHPVPFEKREEVYRPFKKEIKKMIELRQQDRDEKARQEAESLRQKLQLHFKAVAYELVGESSEMLHVESFELNVPEVFFCEDGSWNKNGGFDVSLGNPPWEIWKPNAEEFFERYDPSYRRANKQQKLKIEKHLYKAYPVLEKRWEATRKFYEAGSQFFLDSNYYSYQRWRVGGNFTGGDINLYKVSLERFYQVLKPEGYLSILIPGNIATDRGATGLRHLLLQDATLEELLSFENRKKIFELVDSRFKIALATLQKKKPKQNHEFKAFFYRHDLDDMFSEKTKLVYPVKLSRSAAPDTWGLLELREQQEIDILTKLYGEAFSLLSEEVGPWKIKWRTEFHMTNDSHFFNNDLRGFPLFGGRSINQYRLTQEVPYYVDVDAAIENLLTKEQGRINRAGGSIALAKWHGEEFRIAYREIARSTDKRTLIACIVPPNVFLNNKLPYGVQFEYCPEENDYKKYYSRKQSFVIVSLLNSFIMDFIIRRKVSSTVNMFYVYQLPVIRLSENDMYFYELLNRSAHLICTSEEYDELAKEAGMSGYEEGVTDPELRQKLQNQIDAYVADLYGLTRDELIYILSTFESANHRAEMRRIGQGVVEELDKLRREGRLEWPV